MYIQFNQTSHLLTDMNLIYSLPLLLLLLHPSASSDPLSALSDLDSDYHYVKDGVDAAETELMLGAVLGNNGVLVLLFILVVEVNGEEAVLY